MFFKHIWLTLSFFNANAVTTIRDATTPTCDKYRLNEGTKYMSNDVFAAANLYIPVSNYS